MKQNLMDVRILFKMKMSLMTSRNQRHASLISMAIRMKENLTLKYLLRLLSILHGNFFKIFRKAFHIMYEYYICPVSVKISTFTFTPMRTLQFFDSLKKLQFPQRTTLFSLHTEIAIASECKIICLRLVMITRNNDKNNLHTATLTVFLL